MFEKEQTPPALRRVESQFLTTLHIPLIAQTPPALRRVESQLLTTLHIPHRADTTGFTPRGVSTSHYSPHPSHRADTTGSTSHHAPAFATITRTMNPHFKALEAAYQLRYYLTFKTHFLKPVLSGHDAFVSDVLADVCKRENYHLLRSSLAPDHLRLLISLRPDQTVSQTIRLLKGNLQNELRKELNIRNLWARGYFARSSGSVDLERVRNYVEGQVRHHGYSGNWTKSLKFRNAAFTSPAFKFDHSLSILNYHFVFVTQNRIAVLDETIAPRLFEYLVSVGNKHLFAVDRVGVLPDHIHVVMEGVPSKSANEYALAILNNMSYWMTQKYYGVLKETGAWNVWQPSYYVGTVGEYTSAQISSFLQMAR